MSAPEIIMSHIWRSDLTVRALDDIGSRRTVHLIDNSFGAEMKDYASINPHIHYLRWPDIAPGPLGGEWDGSGMQWSPLSCAASWNWGLREAQSEWVINVNPDILQWPQMLGIIDRQIAELDPEIVLVCGQVVFNVWYALREEILDLGGFDEQFIPCGGENEDILVRISEAGVKWTQRNLPLFHVGSGHKTRADHLGPHRGPYCNTPVFKEKHGFPPNAKEYKAIITRGRA